MVVCLGKALLRKSSKDVWDMPNFLSNKGHLRVYPSSGQFWVTCPFRIRYLNAMSVFHTSHTLPTKSGPGFKVTFPGFQPEGVASAPLVSRTSWKACN